MARDLSSLSKEEFRDFIDSFDNFMFDLDGVLFLGSHPIPVAKSVPQMLHDLGKTVKYVSNNCSRNFNDWQMLFQKSEMYFVDDCLTTPITPAIAYLKNINFNKKIYAISTEVVRQILVDAGFSLADKFTGVVPESIPGLVNFLKNDLDVGAVLVDLDINLNYVSLLLASIYISRPEVLLIFCATDSIIPLGHNFKIIGPHYFQIALEDISGKKGLTFGKPGKHLQLYFNETLKLEHKRTLFVGDSLDQDMAFASLCGYKKLLALSGVTNLESLQQINDPNKKPDYYVNGIADLHVLLNRYL